MRNYKGSPHIINDQTERPSLCVCEFFSALALSPGSYNEEIMRKVGVNVHLLCWPERDLPGPSTSNCIVKPAERAEEGVKEEFYARLENEKVRS